MTTEITQDRQLAQDWAKKLLDAGKWCILDTATTGFDTNDQICQTAVITPEIPEGWQTLVQPTVPISSSASNIHGIKDKDVKNAPTFDQVFLHLMRRIGSRDLVIYNTDFDLRLIKQSLRVHGIQLAFPTSDRRGCRIFTNGGSIHDAMLWYAQYVGEWSVEVSDYLCQKLPGGDHTALGDCKATLEIIRSMAAS